MNHERDKVLQEEKKKPKTSNNTLQILFKKDNPFKIGEEVAITNNSLQQKGKTGVITYISKKQVTLQNNRTGTAYTQSYKIISHI